MGQRAHVSLLPAIDDDASLFPPTVLVYGPGGDTASHQHHCIHLAIAREGRIELAVEGAAPLHAPGAYVGPDVPHAIRAAGAEVALLFVDPESREGRALRRHAGGPAILLDDAARDRLLPHWPEAYGATRDEAFATAAFAALGIDRQAPPAVLHPGVRRALLVLRESDEAVSLQALAAAAGLSAGRLGHLFTEQIGIPPRRYLLWTRVQRAARSIAEGRPITEAAHGAGFADGAHLSRTFRRMFGATPAELARNSRFVQAR